MARARGVRDALRSAHQEAVAALRERCVATLDALDKQDLHEVCCVGGGGAPGGVRVHPTVVWQPRGGQSAPNTHRCWSLVTLNRLPIHLLLV